MVLRVPTLPSHNMASEAGLIEGSRFATIYAWDLDAHPWVCCFPKPVSFKINDALRL